MLLHLDLVPYYFLSSPVSYWDLSLLCNSYFLLYLSPTTKSRSAVQICIHGLFWQSCTTIVAKYVKLKNWKKNQNLLLLSYSATCFETRTLLECAKLLCLPCSAFCFFLGLLAQPFCMSFSGKLAHYCNPKDSNCLLLANSDYLLQRKIYGSPIENWNREIWKFLLLCVHFSRPLGDDSATAKPSCAQTRNLLSENTRLLLLLLLESLFLASQFFLPTCTKKLNCPVICTAWLRLYASPQNLSCCSF